MPLTPFQAARKVCEHGSWRITNLGLQKILYIAQMIFMGENNGLRLVDTDFEAWDYGPVSPEVYHKVKIFGANHIQDVFIGVPPSNDGLREASLHNVCTFLASKKPAELVSITHWKDGAWAKHYQAGSLGIVIPDEDILDEYRRRSAPKTN